MTNASSQSRSGSSGGSSQFPHTEEKGRPGGDKHKDELMFDVDTDLEADNMAGLSLDTCQCLTTMLSARLQISKFGSSGAVKKGIPLICVAGK